jgi:hypothetical protein
MTDLPRWAELVGPPTSPEQARARRQQQASQARFDHALELVEQAATAAASGDQVRLERLVTKLAWPGLAGGDGMSCSSGSIGRIRLGGRLGGWGASAGGRLGGLVSWEGSAFSPAPGMAPPGWFAG